MGQIVEKLGGAAHVEKACFLIAENEVARSCLDLKSATRQHDVAVIDDALPDQVKTRAQSAHHRGTGIARGIEGDGPVGSYRLIGGGCTGETRNIQDQVARTVCAAHHAEGELPRSYSTRGTRRRSRAFEKYSAGGVEGHVIVAFDIRAVDARLPGGTQLHRTRVERERAAGRRSEACAEIGHSGAVVEGDALRVDTDISSVAADGGGMKREAGDRIEACGIETTADGSAAVDIDRAVAEKGKVGRRRLQALQRRVGKHQARGRPRRSR